MITDGGVATVGKRARATVADTCYVIRVSAEDSCFDSTKSKITAKAHQSKSFRQRQREMKRNILGHVTAVVVSDSLPYNLIVLHLSRCMMMKSGLRVYEKLVKIGVNQSTEFYSFWCVSGSIRFSY